MATQPSEFLDWVPDNTTNIDEPPGGQKNTGMQASEGLPFGWFNWMINLIDQWIQYLFQEVEALQGNTYPNYLVTSEEEFLIAIAALTDGGVILIKESFSLTDDVTVPDNTLIIGRKGYSVLTINAPVGLILGDNCSLRDLFIECAEAGATATGTSGGAGSSITVSGVSGTIEVGMEAEGTNIIPGTTVLTVVGSTIGLSQPTSGAVSGSVTFRYMLVNMSGDYCKLLECKFTIPASSYGNALFVTGDANRIRDCVFAGVSGSMGTDPYGINYAAGVDNMDDSSVFLP